MRRKVLSFVIGVALASVSVHAHHSIAGAYDSSRRVTIEGVVAQVQFINPHPFVLMHVTDADGRGQSWRLEMDNRWELVEIGFTATTLKPGDKVVASGSLARMQPQGLYLLRLDRPADGFWYEQVGTSPRIGPRSKL